MKTFTLGMAGAAILLFISGAGVGIAQAGGADWNVEALDSYFEYVPENRPVLSFEDQEVQRVANSQSEEMQLQGPIETGSLPSGNTEDFRLIEIGGLSYRVGLDTGP